MLKKSSKQLRHRQYYDSPLGRATRLVRQAKERALKKGLEFDLTREWLYQCIIGGRCAVTGLPFDLNLRGQGSNPWSPSVDRIDPSRGYTLDNVQCVVHIYNLAKFNFAHTEVVALSKAVLKNESRKKADSVSRNSISD